MFLKLAINSLIDRKGAVSLSVVAMAISIAILLGVEHIRQEVKQNFSSTVSGVDLIVGARTSNVNLLLYSVFRIGAPTNNISWKSFKNFAADPRVDWAVPISLGDSHNMKIVFPMLLKDFLKMMVGLAISVAMVLAIHFLF